MKVVFVVTDCRKGSHPENEFLITPALMASTPSERHVEIEKGFALSLCWGFWAVSVGLIKWI